MLSDGFETLTTPSRTVVGFGPAVGCFPAYIITGDGQRHEYVGTVDSPFELEALGPGECVISPGLIYRSSNIVQWRMR